MTALLHHASHNALGLPAKRYDAILADPPWRFAAGGNKGANAHYGIMRLDDICNMPISDLAKDDCLLFLWATQAMIPQALEVVAAWGFRYLSFLAWSKRTKNGLPANIGRVGIVGAMKPVNLGRWCNG